MCKKAQYSKKNVFFVTPLLIDNILAVAYIGGAVVLLPPWKIQILKVKPDNDKD